MTDTDLSRSHFYVYVFFRDGIPVYVGKGQGQRIYQHSAPGRGNVMLHRMIAKDRVDGTKRVTKRKVAENLSEAEAFDLERLLIAEYGRQPAGTLVNFTDGGEGASNPSQEARLRIGASIRRGRENGRIWVVSEEQRAQISAALTGRKRDPASTAKAVAKQTGAKRTPEQRARMSEAQKGNQNNLGQKRSAETREKLSAWQRGRKMKPEWIEKAAAANRGRKRTPEQCAALSAAKKGVPMSNAHREATRRAMLGREIKPEWIAKRKAGLVAKRAARTHCRHGHDLTLDGAATTNNRGSIICRECRRTARNSTTKRLPSDAESDPLPCQLLML